MISYHWYDTITRSKHLREGIHVKTTDKFQQAYTGYGRIHFCLLSHRLRAWIPMCISLTPHTYHRSRITHGPWPHASTLVESSWNVMAHGDAREGKWRGNWRMEWVASTLHTTSEHGVSSITTADAHTSAASSRLKWRSRRFKGTRPFRRKTKSGFCACAITFQTKFTDDWPCVYRSRMLRTLLCRRTLLPAARPYDTKYSDCFLIRGSVV